MSVYNSEKWLHKSIQSIINQDYKNFEFIIVNDGSTDSSGSIINDFSKIDKRIKCINHPNQGLTKSLIKAVDFSKGDFIARMDADDMSSSDRLRIQLDEILNKNLDLIASNFEIIDKNEKTISRIDLRNKESKIFDSLLNGNSFFPHSGVLFKKSTYLNLGGYSPNFKKSQDIDLWFRFLETGKKIGFCKINKPLTFIRIHNQQLTYKNFDDHYTSLSILNHYGRKHNIDEFLELNCDLANDLIIKIKEDKKYKSIMLKNKLRHIIRNSFRNSFRNTIRLILSINYLIDLRSFLSIYKSDKILHKELSYKILNLKYGI
jgi:glycosyltransferase involved in cell wall biosynthesis